MRLTLLLALGLFGCGTVPRDTSDSGTPLPTFGTITLALTNGFEGNTINGHTVSGQPDELFVSLFPNAVLAPSANASACAGATATDGACCYVPAALSSDGGSGPAGSNDGGPDFVMLDVGPIAVDDVTSNTTLGSVSYMTVVEGFGYAYGYPNLDFGPSAWNTGDVLRVAVGAGPLGAAFTAEALALSAPKTSQPSSIALTQGFTLAWTPEANAQTMSVTVSASRGSVTCTLSDSDKSATVSPSLLSNFVVGDSLSVVLTRATSQAVAVNGGAVTVVSSAASGFTCAAE